MTKKSKDIQRDIFSAEFKKFCRKNIQAPMKELEKTRHNYTNGIYAVIALGCLIEFALIYAMFNTGHLSDNIFEGIICAGLATYVICTYIAKNYKTKAKKIILPKLLSYIGNFSLVETNNIKYYLPAYLHTLDLIPNFNRESFDDCLDGTYNGINVNIAETELTMVTGTGKKRRRTIVFQGLFIHFKSQKKFKHRTIIRRNGLRFFENKEKVNLEDPEFENLFDTYGDDQIEARYLITPAFMNRMVELNKKGIGQKMTISFENDNVNIAVSSSKDWFEIPLFKPATDISNYRAILLELISIFSIIDTLKLDENIGL